MTLQTDSKTPPRLALSAGYQDDAFWQQYAALWKNSLHRSPFEAPRLLQYFSRLSGDKVRAFRFMKDGEMKAAVLLKLSKGNLRFLSDHKTDANFFVFDRRCSQADWREFFQLLLQTVQSKNWTLTLNHQPHWADYMKTFYQVGKESGLYWQNIPYSVCPILEKESPKALFDEINGSRELRYRVNRLKNQDQAEFEVLADDSDLDRWVEEFCDSHVLRWADTPTPSGYKPLASRNFLKECLRAWHEDGLLLRFAVKVAGNRIGFVVGLREENSLIHHSTTFHPDFKKQSPGKALILFMAEWMSKNGYSTLDFGDGNESYKYTVAKVEHQVNRIFAAPKYHLAFIIRTQVIKSVKGQSAVYNLYQNKIKPAFRNIKRQLADFTILSFS
ncbi:MAG: GNAT family N-acetyltransferase [Saprospirales bacterium]|nr:GNAT family N-acetyltransferase [Saprospirales bacterium]